MPNTMTYKSDEHGTFTCDEELLADLFNTVMFDRYENKALVPIQMGEIQEFVEHKMGAEQGSYGDVNTRAGLLVIVGSIWGHKEFCSYFNLQVGR